MTEIESQNRILKSFSRVFDTLKEINPDAEDEDLRKILIQVALINGMLEQHFKDYTRH